MQSQNFRSVGIKGQGSLFNIIDTTPNTGGLIFSVLTGVKRITISNNYTLSVSNLDLGDLSSLTIGSLRLDGDGIIYLNNETYISSLTTNMGVGVSALTNTTGSKNTAVGYQSLMANTTGTQNTAIGYNSLISMTIGDNNTSIGSDAGISLSVDQNHCILLNNTGSTVLQDGEVHIGNQTDQSLTYIHTPFVTDRGTASVGPAAIPVTSSYHEITTTGADTITLADGVNGQHMYIVLVSDGGTATLVRASNPGSSSITFPNAGMSVHLLYLDNGGWYVVGATANILFP